MRATAGISASSAASATADALASATSAGSCQGRRARWAITVPSLGFPDGSVALWTNAGSVVAASSTTLRMTSSGTPATEAASLRALVQACEQSLFDGCAAATPLDQDLDELAEVLQAVEEVRS